MKVLTSTKTQLKLANCHWIQKLIAWGFVILGGSISITIVLAPFALPFFFLGLFMLRLIHRANIVLLDREQNRLEIHKRPILPFRKTEVENYPLDKIVKILVVEKKFKSLDLDSDSDLSFFPAQDQISHTVLVRLYFVMEDDSRVPISRFYFQHYLYHNAVPLMAAFLGLKSA